MRGATDDDDLAGLLNGQAIVDTSFLEQRGLDKLVRMLDSVCACQWTINRGRVNAAAPLGAVGLVLASVRNRKVKGSLESMTVSAVVGNGQPCRVSTRLEVRTADCAWLYTMHFEIGRLRARVKHHLFNAQILDAIEIGLIGCVLGMLRGSEGLGLSLRNKVRVCDGPSWCVAVAYLWQMEMRLLKSSSGRLDRQFAHLFLWRAFRVGRCSICELLEPDLGAIVDFVCLEHRRTNRAGSELEGRCVDHEVFRLKVPGVRIVRICQVAARYASAQANQTTVNFSSPGILTAEDEDAVRPQKGLEVVKGHQVEGADFGSEGRSFGARARQGHALPIPVRLFPSLPIDMAHL